ncbi:hypothetical protein Dip510_001232 [Elusimicrobium posterum]|uniref:hypothetical protein n=1 Tax=Elusimicrobium posterum TaxID=3116653 RepID=UPI003C71F7E6
MKLIKLLLLIIIFSLGVFVGYTKLPQQEATMSAVISMPDLQTYGADINSYNADSAQKILNDFKANMAGAINLTDDQKKAMIKEVETTLMLQNFKIIEYRYLAEIAKNKIDSPSTSAYTRAAQDYNNTKKAVEKYFEELAPKPEAAPAAAQVTTATETKK